MPNQKAVEAYFHHVVLANNCGDLKQLIDLKLKQAGPLLACTVNAIDTIGGMIHGFKRDNSRYRSTQFMEHYLNLSPTEAAFMYTLVRCGVAHEGVTKSDLRFFVYDKQFDPGKFFYRDDNNLIWLNVTELARSYLDVIHNTIALKIHAHLKHVPTFYKTDQDLYSNALPHLTDLHEVLRQDIEEYGFSGSGRGTLHDMLNPVEVGKLDE